MKTAIVTDTNSGITVEEGRQSGIFVLPMPVIIEEHCYLEGVDITNEDLYQAMTADKNLSSSQPSPGDVMDLWNRVLESGYDEIVHIPMSSGLSGSCQTAKQLALDYDSKVQVVDNHRISVTLMESVYDAKFLADQGKSAVEIRKYLEETAYQASIFLTVNSLKYLKKSGRITSSAAAIANILNIKPLLTIQGEKLDLFAKVRGSRQSEKKLIEALKADIASRFLDVPSDRLQIATAGTFEKEEDAKRFQKRRERTKTAEKKDGRNREKSDRKFREGKRSGSHRYDDCLDHDEKTEAHCVRRRSKNLFFRLAHESENHNLKCGNSFYQ